MTLQVSSLLEICAAGWTAKSLEECMDIVYVTNLTALSFQLNILLVLFEASSCEFSNHCTVNKAGVIYEKIDTYYNFHRWILIHANFEETGLKLLIRQRLDNFDISSSSLLSFPCKWRASALKRQILSLYGFFDVLFVSKAIDCTAFQKRFR